jgi:mandelate racemase
MSVSLSDATKSAATIKITGLEVTMVNVPMPVPHRTAGGVLTHAPLVLLDLRSNAGVTGRSYIFTYSPSALPATAQLLKSMEPHVVGQSASPYGLERLLDAKYRLLGTQGLVLMAMSAIDMAAWDILAKVSNLPLVRLLGGAPTSIKAYASLGMDGSNESARGAAQVVESGFNAVKLKIGHARLQDDIEVLRAVRNAVGPDVELMVDYNQSLSVPQAIQRCTALDGEGLAWIEEPVLQTDWAGHAQVRNAVTTPIQLGENWWGTADMARCIAAGASDLVMPDVMKIGGVTQWQRAAALAQAAGLPVSSHLFTEFSAHLLAVTPTAHYLEYMQIAEPILASSYRPERGCVVIPDAPGVGLEWDAPAVEKLRV